MRNLNVTLVQADQKWEDPEANYRNYTALLKDVQTDLILLPEMFHTCFSMRLNLAEPFVNNEALAWLQDMASQKDAAIYTSLMVKDENDYFNRGVFVFPDGTFSHYDKRKTFGLANEDAYFQSGKSAKIVSYRGWNFQLQICYDLRFPEISRNKLSNLSPSFDVLLYVANWPQKRSSHWKALLSARAIENQCYVLGLNRVGTDGNGFDYSGDSRMIDALGNAYLLEENKEMVQTFVMKKDELEEIREKLPFLKDA